MIIKLWEEDTPYLNGDGESDPSLTCYMAEGNALKPAIIVCPGGGYQMKAEHEGAPIAQWLNRIGITAYVLDYRVVPFKHPVPLTDVQRAVRLVRSRAKEWNVDPHRVGVLGFSAGGHLASSIGTHFDLGGNNPIQSDPVDRESCRPDLLVLCYPVISFGEHRHEGSMLNLLGNNPDDNVRRSLSNELQVTPATPPTFMWHTADDAAVPVENCLLFAQALRASGVPFELHIYPHGRHGLGLAVETPQVAKWTESCEIWLRSNGF